MNLKDRFTVFLVCLETTASSEDLKCSLWFLQNQKLFIGKYAHKYQNHN